MLRDVWSLPDSPPDALPGFIQARGSLKILGELFRHILIPYICVNLTLSEQLVHLSAAAHLLLALFTEDATKLMPMQLYIDIMIMIKNIYFCVAKTKIIHKAIFGSFSWEQIVWRCYMAFFTQWLEMMPILISCS